MHSAVAYGLCLFEQKWAVDLNNDACESVALNHPETIVMHKIILILPRALTSNFLYMVFLTSFNS